MTWIKRCVETTFPLHNGTIWYPYKRISLDIKGLLKKIDTKRPIVDSLRQQSSLSDVQHEQHSLVLSSSEYKGGLHVQLLIPRKHVSRFAFQCKPGSELQLPTFRLKTTVSVLQYPARIQYIVVASFNCVIPPLLVSSMPLGRYSFVGASRSGQEKSLRCCQKAAVNWFG